SRGAQVAVRHTSGERRNRLRAHDGDPAWHWLLQGPISSRSLVSWPIRAQWLLRHPRRLVRPASSARRLRAHRLCGLWCKDSRRERPRIRVGSSRGGQEGPHRVSEDSVGFDLYLRVPWFCLKAPQCRTTSPARQERGGEG